MPRLVATDDTQIISIPGPGNFQFSAIRPENLGSTEYTLVTLVLDATGSVEHFKDDLLKVAKNVVEACKKSPRKDNLLFRFLTFNETVNEVHGFKPVLDIDPSTYKDIDPYGRTALFDATFSAVGATLEYAKRLIDKDYDVNGCIYIPTDGMNNWGKTTTKSIREKIERARVGEEIESLLTVLIGFNDPNLSWSKEITDSLEKFKEDAKLDQFVNIGEATPQKLAKLANFVSRSISSTSQALGTGSASQILTF